MKEIDPNCFSFEGNNKTFLVRKGVVLIESFSMKISSAFLFFFCEIFGKVTRFFFLPYSKKKVIGWIEFSNKINAKRVSIFFKNFLHNRQPNGA